MKYSLNYIHSHEYMQKADEIIIPFKRFQELLDLVEKYPDKDFVVDLPEGLTLDFPFLKMCETKLNKGNIYVRLHSLNPYLELKSCQDNEVKFFYSEPVNNFYDLMGLFDLKVSYVYVTAPLFFQMDEVRKTGIPVRLIPNKCYEPRTIPRKNGLHGTWVRPEKIDIYEPYVEVIEFYFDTPGQELALYKIYHDNKKWLADMNTLYFNFNMNVDNNLVYEGLDEMRLNCGQKCETVRCSCHMCDKVVRFEKIGRDWANKIVKEKLEQESQT